MPLAYLLDTNVLSEPMRPVPNAGVMTRLLQLGDAVATGAPAWHEIDYGRLRLPAGRRRRAIDSALEQIASVLPVLPYDASAARWHARERARLERRGRPASFVDGQLAAIAAVHSLTLVTRNVRHFAAFAGIQVESWFV